MTSQWDALDFPHFSFFFLNVEQISAFRSEQALQEIHGLSRDVFEKIVTITPTLRKRTIHVVFILSLTIHF